MSKIARDFGAYVNNEAFNIYNEGGDKFSEEDIADMFVQFTKKQQKEQLAELDYVDSWIDEWLKLFPLGVRSGSKLVRSDRSMCLKKMAAFIKNTRYDRDLIFHATKEYIREFALRDYAYMKCATYFIDKKDEGSELAAQCEKCKNDDMTKEETNMFNEFI